MDHKSWLWRKRSSEKTIVAAEKVATPLRKTEEQTRTLPTKNEVGPERSAKNLNEKLATVLDCHAKDDTIRAQESDTGCEKVKSVCLKQELDEALKQGKAANEKLTRSDAALKECVQQLKSVQEEQEQRIQNAIMKTSIEYEKAQKKLEEKLEETSKQLANLATGNTHLSKALLAKEKVIEDLQKHKSQADAEFNVLMARLDSVEKENAYLKYEFHMLEKELEIRNEEMEYNRRSADAAHKQHLESVKKVGKLEAECQRLRLLMRKRLPGPVTLANMKSEVDMLGRDHMDMRRRKQNPTRDLVVRNATEPEISSKKISFVIEQLHNMEEENKALKEIVTKKNTELHSSRIMYVRTASRLSQAEAQLIELSKGQKSMELTRFNPISNECSDIASDDGFSSSGSWANALISELEHFRTAKLKSTPEHKAIEVSDMSLMDDFVEMEKLAIVSVNSPGNGSHPNFTGKDLVPVAVHSEFSNRKQEMQSKNVATEKTFDWLQIVLNAMLEQKRISKRSLYELFEDIKIALGYINHPTSHAADTTTTSNPGESDPRHITGYITWKSPNTSPSVDSLTGALAIDTSVEEKGNQHNQSDLSESVGKLIKLIEGINPTSLVSNNTPDCWSKTDQNSNPFHSATSSDYFVRVFQWKRSELSDVLQQFVCTCTDLLNGKADLENFATEVLFALDWIINNRVTPKDASSARNKIKKHFGWMESQTENEPGVHTSEEQSSCLPLVASSHEQDVLLQMEEVQCKLQEENSRLKDELKNMEGRLQSAIDKSEALMIQHQESEQSIRNLQAELETIKESKGMIEDQIENQKSINEDLDTQLSVAKAKLNEVFQKFSSLEVELEDKNNCCEDLETTCLELQLQLESVAKETPKYSMNQEGKQSQNGWEMTTASIKLAECQETILHLGKQLKALASPREAVLFDKVFCNSSTAAPTSDNKNMNKRSSLRDQMIAEDDTKAEILKSPKIKETIITADTQKELLNSDSYNASCAPNGLVHTPEAYLSSKHEVVNNAAGALAVVPSKKQGGFGLLRKLLLRRKKGGNKKSRALAKA
ncbi:filament-like plant protein 7 [Fagus crenata]